MTENAEAIRAAILRANAAENDVANIGVDGVIAAWKEIGHPDMERAMSDDALRPPALYRSFPDLHRVIHTIVVEPPFVAFRWTMSGTQAGEFRGQPATNQPGWFTGMTIGEFEDGRMRRFWLCSGPLQPGSSCPPEWAANAPTVEGDVQTAADIRAALEGAFRAEGDFANLGWEKVIAAWETICHDDPEATLALTAINGQMFSREERDEDDRRFYASLPPDYRRTLDGLVIEPPFAAYRFTSTIPGRKRTTRVSGIGLAQFERGLARRCWLHVPSAPQA